MLMGLVALVALVPALFRRRALAALTSVRLRLAWLLPAGLALQVLVVSMSRPPLSQCTTGCDIAALLTSPQHFPG